MIRILKRTKKGKTPTPIMKPNRDKTLPKSHGSRPFVSDTDVVMVADSRLFFGRVLTLSFPLLITLIDSLHYALIKLHNWSRCFRDFNPFNCMEEKGTLFVLL